MRHLSFLISIGLVLSASPVHGLQIEWAGGARNIDVTSATTCTLLVTPPPGKAALPARWRLFWAGQSSVADPVQLLSAPGPADAAPLCDLLPSASEEERRSNTSTAGFCGPGDGIPTAKAAYVLLLDPSLEARFAVAPEFGPLLGEAAAWSEVTVNGGSGLEFPAELRSYRPLADTLGGKRAGLVGRGLDRVRRVLLAQWNPGAPEDTLEILSQGPTTLTIRTPANLGSSPVLVLSNGEDESASALSLDGIADPDPGGSSFGPRMIPDYPYEAKDFAFIHANGQYHLFYIRINPTVPDSLSEIDFGHAVSTNLYNWTQLPPVMEVRPGKWDDGHVWAPSIVEQDGTYYMFYTGVTKSATPGGGIQRIGLAVSTDLLNWTRFDEPILSCADAPWSYCDYAQGHGKHLRDPFVMLDPNDATRWLMYYVARLGVDPEQQIVGVAEGPALDGAWSDLVPLWCTDAFPNNFMGFSESPMAFPRGVLWYLFLSTNSGHPIRYKTASSPIADSTGWSGIYRLYDAPGAGGNSDVWIAPEFLRVPGHDYLAVVNRAAVTPGIEIREMIWGTVPSFSLTPPAVTAVEAGGATGLFSLARVSPVGRRGGIELRAELPAAGRARLEIYDVSGRRVARVLDAWLPAGPSVHRWDGRTATGEAAGSGVYFARMTALGDSRSLRVAHVR